MAESKTSKSDEAKNEPSITYKDKTLFWAKGKGLSRYIAASSLTAGREIAKAVLGERFVTIGNAKHMPSAGTPLLLEKPSVNQPEKMPTNKDDLKELKARMSCNYELTKIKKQEPKR